ncbi:MAG TPA: hypothetical protein VFI09_01860 [Solirubrobacterales bacterium]|nr:hypothetical protein [Solirubrobacterales bacterium]
MRARSRTRRALCALALALVALMTTAAGAQAASPAWKLLAAAGPTHLPPTQSEVQRVAVEAEGGTFTLSQSVTGEAHRSFGRAVLTFTAGSKVATYSGASNPFEAGQEVISSTASRLSLGAKVLAAETGGGEGSTVEFDTLPNSSGVSRITATSKVLDNVTGTFYEGETVTGEGIPAATTITAVDSTANTLTISNYPTAGGTYPLSTIRTSAPLSYDAAAEEVQAALEALPGYGPGSISVSGGPGGDAEHPYFIAFGGAFAEQDVEQLGADASGLAGEHAAVHVFTTVPGGAGTGEIAVNVTNVGGAPSQGEYTLQLGPLPPGVVISGAAKGEGWSCPSAVGESSIACTSTSAVPPLSPTDGLIVPVEVQTPRAVSADAAVGISGGGALPATYEMPLVVSSIPAHFGAAGFWAGAYDEDGMALTQAGGHPFSAQSFFLVNTVRAASGQVVPAGDSKNVIVDLPPGFAGNPLATPRCPQSQVTIVGFEGSPLCNEEMQLGRFEPVISKFGESTSNFITPFFNDVPAQGYAAEFTTKIGFPLQSLLVSVRSEEDFGIRVTAPNNPNFNKIFGAYAALEGSPPGAHGKSIFDLSTDCAEQAREAPLVRSKFDTWQEPGAFVPADTDVAAVTGCEKLHFNPAFSLQPTTTTGSSPAGATATLHIPQDGLTDPAKLSAPHLEQSVIELPRGLDLNPSSANGMQACSEAQIGYRGDGFALPNPMRFNDAPPSCPEGSKLGTAEVKTPLLEEALQGTIYLARQEENPFGSLIALYLVVESQRFGITVKVPGEVHIDPDTGQLGVRIEHSPQVTFEDIILHFRGGGPRSELATPEVCGHYETKGAWTPWSAPESGPPAQTSDGFEVSANCSASAGARPFAPSFEAGTKDPLAGSYSPFTIKLGRADGEQELKSLEFTLPQGLFGKLAGIPYCSEADIASAGSRTGEEEQKSPSCPRASHLGSVEVAGGVGPEPVHVGGQVYLAGPYQGAPLSAVVITPALAGPFDLGNVVVRSPMYLDPATAQITVKSGQVPSSLRGIPVKLRQLSIAIDRPGFTLNPTSCEAMALTATAHSYSGASADLHNRFQVGGCAKLPYKPRLFTRLYGPTRRGGFPRFRGIVTAKAGEAGTSALSVTLPSSEFLEQGHIRTVCTRVQFAAKSCPKGSIYGHVKVLTPLLDYPLVGPAYLRSSNHKLPDLVLALHGPPSQPVAFELDGRIDSAHRGIRTTFEGIPDAPFSKAILSMQGGKKSLLVNSRNICARPGRAIVRMNGQNGKLDKARPTLKNGKCGKARKHRRHRR